MNIGGASGGPTGAGGGGGAGSGVGGSGVGGGSGGRSFDGGVTPTDGGVVFRWTDLSPCHFPATVPYGYRTTPMVAFDSDRGKVIVYGAYSGNYSDLWEVDVTTGLRTDRTTCAYVDTIPEWNSAFVYDAGRKRVVLFPYSASTDVREWDPVADVWTDRPTPPGSAGAVPEGAANFALYDPTGKRVIVFVVHTDTLSESIWAWDGVTGVWTLLEDTLPVSNPIGLPSMAFDADRGVIWGFGGVGSSNNPIDNLWSWNVATTAFTDLTPATRPAAWPAARAGAGLVYDGTRGKLVLYGGMSGADARRDIWEWDPAAGAWADRTASGVSPTGDALPAGVAWPTPDFWSGDRLFVVPGQGRLVLLDSADLVSIGQSGAWLWDGQHGTWTEPKVGTPPALWPASESDAVSTAWDADDRALYLTQASQLWRWTADDGRWKVIAWHSGGGAPNSLPSLDGAVIAYDPKARQVVLFGGYVNTDGTTTGALTDDLWRWNPATSQLSLVSRPAGAVWPEPRRYHAMAYDPVRQRVLLFGGSKPEASNELWALDTANAGWSDLSGTSTSAGVAWPEARIHPRLVLDPERNVLVLKGGGDTSPSPVQALDATWELAAGTTSWSKRADASSATPFGFPLTFMTGVGLVTLSASWDPNDSYFGLWRWDSTNAVWTSLAVAAPVMPSGDIQGPVGAGGRLLWLRAPSSDSSVPAEDAAFFHLWQWGPQ